MVLFFRRYSSGDNHDGKDVKPEGAFVSNSLFPFNTSQCPSSVDPILERLTTLENNFTLMLSRGEIEPYDSLEAALNAPSRFTSPMNIKVGYF